MATLLGIAIAAIGVADTAQIESLVDDANATGLVSVGAGLYVVIIAGAALAITSGINTSKRH